MAVQRRRAIRVVSAFRTVSREAVLVLASTPPIELLIKEKQEIYEKSRQSGNEQRRVEVKRMAQERLMERWQHIWDTTTKGCWTHRLIADLRKWCSRPHGQINFYLTQALTGHGCFMSYLERFKKRESSTCLLCGHVTDDAEHAIFECPGNGAQRSHLRDILHDGMGAQNLVPAMLE